MTPPTRAARARPAPARHGAAAAGARGPAARLPRGRRRARPAARRRLPSTSTSRSRATRARWRARSRSAWAATAREHERFGTATVRAPTTSSSTWPPRGRETYDAPGALPRVAPAPLAEDLRRRDFTSTRWRSALTGDDLGHLYDPHGGPGRPARPASCACSTTAASSTTPRACCGRVRYEARLGFAHGPGDRARWRARRSRRTRSSTVSGARIRDELMDLLRRARGAGRGRAACASSGSTAPSTRRSTPDPELVASAPLGAAAIGADRALAALAALVRRARPRSSTCWLGDLHLAARASATRSRARRAWRRRSRAALREREHSPSELRALLARRAARGAGAGAGAGRAVGADPALGDRPAAACGSRSAGDDLLAAGVPGGPGGRPRARGDAAAQARRRSCPGATRSSRTALRARPR